jgi:hypothetical protein
MYRQVLTWEGPMNIPPPPAPPRPPRRRGDPGPTWVLWWLAWAVALCWPLLLGAGGLGIGLEIAWLALLFAVWGLARSGRRAVRRRGSPPRP